MPHIFAAYLCLPQICLSHLRQISAANTSMLQISVTHTSMTRISFFENGRNEKNNLFKAFITLPDILSPCWTFSWLLANISGSSCCPYQTFYVYWNLPEKMSDKVWALCRTAYIAITANGFFFHTVCCMIQSLWHQSRHLAHTINHTVLSVGTQGLNTPDSKTADHLKLGVYTFLDLDLFLNLESILQLHGKF